MSLLITVSIAWALVLFGVALLGERRGARFEPVWPVVYALSLAVYCTAWTFYGTVTQAARWGMWLPPTFIGTIALFWLGGRFLRRLAELTREQHSASIADLIATRFGRDSRLAATITAVALIGIVPYIALQLKAVAMSYTLLAQADASSGWQDASLWVTVVLAAFALLFGTREAALTAHNRGLILAMGFESLFKLLVMLAVGGYVVTAFPGGLQGLLEGARQVPASGVDSGYLALVGLGAVAMFTLPHQFHLAFVELRQPAHLRTARWLFPLYLLLIALPVLPLAWAGQLRLGAEVPSDLYVLALPRLDGANGLAVLAFLGGLSAATGMVILASLTLSTMLASHWLAPWRLAGAARTAQHADLLPTVLRHRRLGVVLVLLLAWLYSQAMGLSEALADIGALSFSALAQLAPAVVAAVYAPGLSARAVWWGLVSGCAAWLWLLLLPMVIAARPDWAALSWFDPAPWLAATGLDGVAGGVLCSLLVNALVLLGVSRLRPTGRPAPGSLDRRALADLALRFVPVDKVAAVLGDSASQRSPVPALPEQVQHIERLLAQVIGATSARVLLDAVREGRQAPLETVATLVGETSRQLRFNQQLLEAALENMSQGISVVDAQLRLTAWNARYAQLFDYPATLLQVGTPVAELVRYNARRGLLSGGEPEVLVQRRVLHMHAGTSYVSERQFRDGTVIEIRGNPMPGGGFVATFTDVTDFRRAEAALKSANETLESRVSERTAELDAARLTAERANQAKSRLLAAVSHDLAQPLHAAHLFTHALGQQLVGHPAQTTAGQIGGALASAEALLGSLLDISRLEAGGLAPQRMAFALLPWLQGLAAEAGVLAEEAGLRLRQVPCRLWVDSDPQLLRRVVQNFLANAVRYTRSGSILLGCRRRAGQVWIEVWDTGRGIEPADQALVFEEFRRLDKGGPGLGLGLAIAERIARLLDHPLAMRSQPGKGTVFAIGMPIVAAHPASPIPPPEPESAGTAAGRLLVVDNDPAVLEAMRGLLGGWGFEVCCTRDPDEALALWRDHDFAAALLDLHLDHNRSGFELVLALRAAGCERPMVVITADHSSEVKAQAGALGVGLLHKPLKPLALRSWLRRLGGG